MGILNFFRKENTVSLDRTSENGFLGPTYFDGLTEPILNPKNLDGHEWRRKLRSKNKEVKFIINTQNGVEYDEDFSEEVDTNGQIELIDGSILDFEQAKRNGFDWIMVNLINERGKQIECISEETA